VGELMAKDDLTPLLILAGAGALAYILYENGTLATWFPSLFPGIVSTAVPAAAAATPASTTAVVPITATPAAAPAPTPAPAAPTGLTLANVASYPFAASGQSNHDQLAFWFANAPQINAEFDSGTFGQIAGNSVLAALLGFKPVAVGAAEIVQGQNYIFDGTNWNLVPKSPLLPGLAGTRVGIGQIHSRDYRFRRNG
jgi:hypothetical protein